MCGGRWYIEISLPSSQFCCEVKTLKKKKKVFKKKSCMNNLPALKHITL